MKRMVMIALALSSVVQICSYEYTCEPEVDCTLEVGGVLVPNPYNCKSYYSCSRGKPSSEPIDCPDNQYFTATGVCLDREDCDPDLTCFYDFTCMPEKDCTIEKVKQVPNPDNCKTFYYCIGDGIPAPSPTDCPEDEYFTSAGFCYKGEGCDPDFCTNTCNLTCLDGVDYIPVAGDCSSYIDCVNPSRPKLPCPELNPYFNGEKCVSNINECCNVCTAVCPDVDVNTLVSDPNNCYGYVICFTDGTQVSDNCPENKIFDPAYVTCSEKQTCQNYCLSNQFTTDSTTSDDVTSESTSSDVTSESTSSDLTSESTSSTKTATMTTPQSSCNDNFVCPGSVPNGAFPYCDFCNQEYYECNNGVTTLEMCPDGFVFDYTINYCVLEDVCPYSSRSVKSVSTIDPGNCDQSLTCPISNGAFSYCEACIQSYYECNNGFASMVTCPDGFVFDYTIKYCVQQGDCPYYP